MYICQMTSHNICICATTFCISFYFILLILALILVLFRCGLHMRWNERFSRQTVSWTTTIYAAHLFVCSSLFVIAAVIFFAVVVVFKAVSYGFCCCWKSTGTVSPSVLLWLPQLLRLFCCCCCCCYNAPVCLRYILFSWQNAV